jgi:hypothetical protein
MSEERIGVRRNSYISGSNPQEDILKLLDGLEELAENAYSFFGKAWGVDLEEFHMHTNKIRASLPDEMRRASRLTSDSEKIVSNANEEAEEVKQKAVKEANRIVDEARHMAAKLIDSSEINRLSKAQAHEIISGAESTAREVRRGADEYAKEVLIGLENHLAKVTGALQKGRDKLENRIINQEAQEPLIPSGRGIRR